MLDAAAYQLSPNLRPAVRVKIDRSVIARVLKASFWRECLLEDDGVAEDDVPYVPLLEIFTPYALSRELIELRPPLLPTGLIFGDPSSIARDALQLHATVKTINAPQDIAGLVGLNHDLRRSGQKPSGFRPNGIVVQNFEYVAYPPSGELHGLVRTIFRHLKSHSDASEILAGATALGLAHPFRDGNGRTMRAFAMLHMRASTSSASARLWPTIVFSCRRKIFWRALLHWIASDDDGPIRKILRTCSAQADVLMNALRKDSAFRAHAASPTTDAQTSSPVYRDVRAMQASSQFELGANSGQQVAWNRGLLHAMDRHVANFLSLS